MGKSTISMAIFNSYVSHYQRVTSEMGWDGLFSRQQKTTKNYQGLSDLSGFWWFLDGFLDISPSCQHRCHSKACLAVEEVDVTCGMPWWLAAEAGTMKKKGQACVLKWGMTKSSSYWSFLYWETKVWGCLNIFNWETKVWGTDGYSTPGEVLEMIRLVRMVFCQRRLQVVDASPVAYQKV